MTIQTFAQVLALATSCQHLVDPYMLAHDVIQVGEWHNAPMRSDAISPVNRFGTRDYGLAQINESNFSMLGLTKQTAMDPCRSVAAGAVVFATFASYNSGNPASKAGIAYALRIISGPIASGSPAVTTASIERIPIRKEPAHDPPLREVFAQPVIKIAAQ